MSFLNPVNEPVKRFKSTDTGAPQINYNARVAGDVKAVLKACLVTGYGAVSSAGWSIVNEVAHVAEFVSPSAAMSDYRLGIDDSATNKTDWYYQYQDARVNPSYNNPTKSFTFADKANVANGWQLFATERGIVFVEFLQHSTVNKLSARITFWGQSKSGIPNVTGKNIVFFNLGHNGGITNPNYFYAAGNYIHNMLEGNTSTSISTATISALSAVSYALDVSNLDLVSQIYIASDSRNMIVGELPALLSKVVNATVDVYGLNEQTIDSRPVFSVCAGYATGTESSAYSYSRTFLIRTDFWEY